MTRARKTTAKRPPRKGGRTRKSAPASAPQVQLAPPPAPKPTAADVVAEARTWLGTRWHHQARARGVGVDCVGLPAGIGLALGLVAEHQLPAAYLRRGPREVFLEHCERLLERVEGPPAPGHVLALWLGRQGHLGIVVPRGPGLGLIHAEATRGIEKVVEVSLDPAFLAQRIGLYRFRGLAP